MKTKIRNYEVQTKLGSGSYGVIFKALNKNTHQICVLKQISLNRLSEKARKSAVNEATIMGKLIHPFIVRYQQSFIEENNLNIVMQYCDNGDLSMYLKMQNKKSLKEQKIWKFFIQICIGLQYIHKNKILHRDIKTLNIFLNKNQEIKIGDLGVAKMLTSNQFAQTMVGTPFYLSPQLCQQKPYNEKSDIWALGCMLYELCTYKHPFEAQNQASLILKIIRGKYSPIPQFYSKQLKDMIDMCLERDYKRRPSASHILSRPKIQELISQFSIDKTINQYMTKIQNQKEGNKNISQAEEINHKINKQPTKQNVVKVIDQPKKDTNLKKQQLKKQVPKIINTPVKQAQKQKDSNINKIHSQNIIKRQSKNQFQSNLARLIDENQKEKKIMIKQNPIYFEMPWKNNEQEKNQKKEQKIQKVIDKIEQIKNPKLIQNSKSPNTDKKSNILISQKKVGPTVEIASSVPLKKQKNSQFSQNNKINPAVSNLAKPPLMPSKPPLQYKDNREKQHVTKVKVEKIVQPKVYESQKNVSRPQGIIKSGGFSSNIQHQKYISNSQEKINQEIKSNCVPLKRPSVYGITKQKDEAKQLFGPSPTIQYKSQKNLKNEQQSSIQVKRQTPNLVRKQQNVNKGISRVRKGGKNEMSRYAKNVSKYNQITKQEEDMVMNLPNKLNNKQMESSDSQEQTYHKSNHIIEDLKAKTNKKFQLKEINHDLIVQKYEDLMMESGKIKQNHPQTQKTQNQTNEENLQNQQNEPNSNIDSMIEEQYMTTQLQVNRKNSRNSNEPIQQILQNEINGDSIQQVENLQNQFSKEYYAGGEQNSEWSYDEQPQLPLLQQRQTGDFEQNNPYLVEQQQTVAQKKNYLQLKLKQNMKRQDQINKFMQIKIEECKSFLSNHNILNQILDFFRKKINMDSEYTDEDQKEVQIFLKKKGLTDHRKFQNIYKIMHFEMELENTRKIIQRICKKLSEFTTDQ